MSIFLIFYIVMILGYRLFTHLLLIKFKLSSKTASELLSYYPGLSILVPIKGPVEDLGGLRALLLQDYPGPIELIIGIRDAADSAVQATKQLVSELRSKVDVKWEIGGPPSGLNPKNANLAQAFRLARFDWIYCSDVDTRPGITHLKEMMESSESNPLRFVTSISIHERPKNLGACLEVFGTNLEATGFFLFTSLNPKYGVVNGASNLFHRSLLEKVGGFSAVVNSLTDDLLFGKLFVAAGAEGRLCRNFCRVDQHRQSLRGFKERYVRWLMITKYFRGEIFWPAPFNWLGQWILLYGVFSGSKIHCEVGIGLLLLRMVETLFVEILSGASRSDWWLSFTILFYDLAMPYLWLTAVLRKEVTWGGNRLRVSASGRLEKIA